MGANLQTTYQETIQDLDYGIAQALLDYNGQLDINPFHSRVILSDLYSEELYPTNGMCDRLAITTLHRLISEEGLDPKTLAYCKGQDGLGFFRHDNSGEHSFLIASSSEKPLIPSTDSGKNRTAYVIDPSQGIVARLGASGYKIDAFNGAKEALEKVEKEGHKVYGPNSESLQFNIERIPLINIPGQGLLFLSITGEVEKEEAIRYEPKVKVLRRGKDTRTHNKTFYWRHWTGSEYAGPSTEYKVDFGARIEFKANRSKEDYEEVYFYGVRDGEQTEVSGDFHGADLDAVIEKLKHLVDNAKVRTS
jgi:hypothetical protein